MDPEIGAECAFWQAAEEDRDMWRRNGSPMSFGRDPSVSFDRVGWSDMPSTYIVCAEDRAIQPAAQRAWAERATTAIERPWAGGELSDIQSSHRRISGAKSKASKASLPTTHPS
jgi:hypothetical protein